MPGGGAEGRDAARSRLRDKIRRKRAIRQGECPGGAEEGDGVAHTLDERTSRHTAADPHPDVQDMLLRLAGDDPAMMRIVHEVIKDPRQAMSAVGALKKLAPTMQDASCDGPEEEEGLPEGLVPDIPGPGPP